MSAPAIVEEPRTTAGSIDAIYRRRAVRAYKPDAIEEHRLRSLLEAAVHAPTAMHQEPWRFIIVQNRALLERLSDRAKELANAHLAHHGPLLKRHDGAADKVFAPLADPDFNIFYDAGTLVVICAKPTNEFVGADCWLAAENLMLSACADGLGTCCIGFALPALNTLTVKAELGIPADVHAFAAIIVGVPRGDSPAVPRKPPIILNWLR